ncbi:MAG: DUF2147 domain-containing protein [Phenylobacterium sp.]
MRTTIIAACLTLAAGPALAADPIEGDWMASATTKVRIAPCPGKADRMCGTIAWLKNPNDKAGKPQLDVNNPNAALQSRPILGMPFIRDFKRAEPGRWTGGKIYDPNSGKTYDSKMKVNPDGTLKLDGCVLMICQSQTWKRAG